MEIDASIIELGEKLDAWWDDFCPMLDSGDRAAQGNTLLRGFEIAKEFDRLKAQGLSAIAALLDRHDAVTQEERATSLIRGFEFGGRLADTLHDEFRDIDGETEVWRLLDRIVLDLNEIGSGRAALELLFDNPDAGIRASAGSYLIDLMPERVVPMLRQIDEKSDGSSPSFGAHWALPCLGARGKVTVQLLDQVGDQARPGLNGGEIRDSLFVIPRSRRVRPEVAGPMTGSATKQSSPHRQTGLLRLRSQ